MFTDGEDLEKVMELEGVLKEKEQANETLTEEIS